MNLGVIDYGGGNLRSLLRALQYLGQKPRIVSSPGDFKDLTHLAFPGQGAFGDCMANLLQRDLAQPLKDWLAADKPFFGICIGYQLLFEGSEESPGTEGLGILKGHCVRFPSDLGLKIPHMGWNIAHATHPQSPQWAHLPEDPHFYFVHSYYPRPEDKTLIASTTDYGLNFPSSIQRGNLYACQFHPEKSQHTGLQLLKNFLP